MQTALETLNSYQFLTLSPTMLHNVYQLFFPVSILFSSPHSSYKLQFNLGFIRPKDCLGFFSQDWAGYFRCHLAKCGGQLGSSRCWKSGFTSKYLVLSCNCLNWWAWNLHLKMSILDLHRVPWAFPLFWVSVNPMRDVKSIPFLYWQRETTICSQSLLIWS